MITHLHTAYTSFFLINSLVGVATSDVTASYYGDIVHSKVHRDLLLLSVSGTYRAINLRRLNDSRT